MTLLRVFIAIEIPLPIRQEILEQTKSLRGALGSGLVRWVPIENMHLTLKFIGDVSPANVEMISQMLSAEAAACAPFTIRIGGLGSFPAPRRARVIWVGIQAPSALDSLHHGIESVAARLGYEAEARPFAPHLTVGRVRQPIRPGDQQKVCGALEQSQVANLGSAEVTAVRLFNSDLKPSGAVYTCLFSAPLKGRNTDENE